ncbi:MAG: DUF3344 domain-containing protein [Candidatus Krumholzibacteria bacterium]|nr:DUF3344 domain-containing protein [Candidatus Krumholzibacteria bacterium]
MKCCARAWQKGGWILLLVLLGSAPPVVNSAQAGTPISLYETHAGHVNFVGTAGSLRRGSNLGDACAVDNFDSAPLNDLPAGATIRAAYLYWAGSYANQGGSSQRSPDWNITFEGQSLGADRQFTERYGLGSGRYDFFSGMTDVTAIVAAKGNGLYTFGNLDVNTGRPHCNVQAVLAGWSLIVVYELASESNRVVNIFDGFEVYRGGRISVTASNFEISAADINGKVGHLTWEGDAENSGSLAGFTESLIFNGNAMLDGLNPTNNQFNSTVNVLGSSDQWGVDLDIYDVTPYLNAGDTQATTVYRSGQDLVLLSAEVVSVTNIPLTDLTFSVAPNNPLSVYIPGQITVNLVNNGPSDEPLPVVMNVTLPQGLTYLGTAGGPWTVDDSGLPTLVYYHPGPVNAGAVLPVVIDVLPNEEALGTPDLMVAVGGGSFDFDLANNLGTVVLNVIKSSAELASTSFTTTVSDPISGTVNPKAIPGATVLYTVTTSNLAAGSVDRNTVWVTNPVPNNTLLYVDDFPGGPGGSVLFVDGAPRSGLRLRTGQFGTARQGIHFSNDGGATYDYRPVPDALGFDAAVTHVQTRLRGTFRGRDNSGPTSFSLKFQVMLQ